MNVVNSGQHSTGSRSPTGPTGPVSDGIPELNYAGMRYYANILSKRSVNTWIIDSGASYHAIFDKNLYTSNVKLVHDFVQLPNHTKIPITHIGDILLNNRCLLRGVICVPTFKLNLMSINKVCRDNTICFLFAKNFCKLLQINSSLIASLTKTGKIEATRGLYEIEEFPAVEVFCDLPKAFAISSKNDHNSAALVKEHIWHFRLGHLSFSSLRALKAIDSSISCKEFSYCEVCMQAKQKKLPFPLSNKNTSSIIELLHCDLWGPFPVPTINKHVYFLTIVDDFSRMTWIHLLKHKHETKETLRNFIEFIQN